VTAQTPKDIHAELARPRQVVLDVGTGSGVLAIWAAKAGAKRVYAVEATAMATHARALAERNGVGQVVQILEGYMEQQNLPEKVRPTRRGG
jgi:type I protein arginine methyltransferase